MNKQHKYELGITFSFIIAMAPKCQRGHNLHPINIFTSIIRLLVSLKYLKRSEEMLFFFIGFLLVGTFKKKITGEKNK